MRRLVALLLGLTAIDMALIAQVGYAADPPSGRTTTLQIEGMTCGACATSVKIVLGKLDITPGAIRLTHLDCATGAVWSPPARA